MEPHGPRISRRAFAQDDGSGRARARNRSCKRGGAVDAPQFEAVSDPRRRKRELTSASIPIDSRTRSPAWRGARPTAVSPAPWRSWHVMGWSSASAPSASAWPAAARPTTTDTIYDLESMTKVLATTSDGACCWCSEASSRSRTASPSTSPTFSANAQGQRARARSAALLVGTARRQPEGRHGRHRRDLGLHARRRRSSTRSARRSSTPTSASASSASCSRPSPARRSTRSPSARSGARSA